MLLRAVCRCPIFWCSPSWQFGDDAQLKNVGLAGIRCHSPESEILDSGSGLPTCVRNTTIQGNGPTKIGALQALTFLDFDASLQTVASLKHQRNDPAPQLQVDHEVGGFSSV